MASLTFERLSEQLRVGEPTYTLPTVVIHTGEKWVYGRGKISPEGDKLVLDVTLNEALPEFGGTKSRAEFWKVGGIIENHIPFWTLALPHTWNVSSARFVVHGSHFHVNRIHHITGDLTKGLENAILTEATDKEGDGGDGTDAFAVLTNFELVHREEFTVKTEDNPYLGGGRTQKADTLRGEFGSFDYGLIQQEKDCLVGLRCKPDTKAAPGEIKRVFDALLWALAFAHGQHTWPQYYRIQRDRTILEEWCRAKNDLPRSHFLPVSHSACFHGARLQSVLEKMMACHLADTTYSKAFGHHLFLSREAGGDTTPHSVGTLGLCAVLEGLVSLLFDECVKDEGNSGAVAFEAKRATLVKQIEAEIKAGADADMTKALKRFAGMLGGARCYRPGDKFERLVEQFGLPWDRLKPVWDAWARQRNTLAHGSSNAFGTDDLIETSRIAGGINILALSALSYSGRACLSTFEDAYIDLK